MVVAKTQIRGAHRSGQRDREKKIAQLQELSSVSAARVSAQATSRKKEVERLQTTELARSNIQRPYIKFYMKRNSGKHPLEIRSVEIVQDLKVIPKFSASVSCVEENRLMGRNGRRENHDAESRWYATRRESSEARTSSFRLMAEKCWGTSDGGYFAQDHGESITKGMTGIDWLGSSILRSQQELRGCGRCC